jgi:hypothetical protein
VDERIREAVADESSRAGAIGEAAGVAPLLCNRLREDEPKQAQFMLVFDEYLYGPHATQFWAGLARMDRAAFEKQAASLVGPQGIFSVLRAIAAEAGIS